VKHPLAPKTRKKEGPEKSGREKSRSIWEGAAPQNVGEQRERKRRKARVLKAGKTNEEGKGTAQN